MLTGLERSGFRWNRSPWLPSWLDEPVPAKAGASHDEVKSTPGGGPETKPARCRKIDRSFEDPAAGPERVFDSELRPGHTASSFRISVST